MHVDFKGSRLTWHLLKTTWLRVLCLQLYCRNPVFFLHISSNVQEKKGERIIVTYLDHLFLSFCTPISFFVVVVSAGHMFLLFCLLVFLLCILSFTIKQCKDT